MEHRDNPPSINKINSFWDKKLSKYLFHERLTDPQNMCWRCEKDKHLERCHIIPHALGGSNDASNLVILCHDCHIECPDVDDKNFMFQWIESTSFVWWANFEKYKRIINLYKKIYGEYPYEFEVDDLELTKNSFSSHSGKVSIASMVWMISAGIKEKRMRKIMDVELGKSL